MSGFYQYIRLIFGIKASQNVDPSEQTLKISGELFLLLQARKDNPQDRTYGLARGRRLLAECKEFEMLAYVTNAKGYNVLQVAVITADESFVRILVDEGWNLNNGNCSLPLHLACKIGNRPLVELLLKHGASAMQKSGMCYPGYHIPIQHVPSRFHFLETDIYACDASHELPVMYAIQYDRVDVLKSLMESKAMTYYVWPCNLQLLHYACKFGAYNSICYLMDLCPNELNVADEYGMTPFLYSVQWGKRFISLLADGGANALAINSSGQSALHLLFASIKDPLELYECTRYLLACGLEQEINFVDRHGNTALHVLVDLVNRKLEKEGQNGAQNKYDEQTLQTLRILLQNNCDPDLLNDSGVTALHKLILTFDFVISNDPSGITLETLPVRENYKIDLDVLYRALEILLQTSAAPHKTTGAGRTPLVILLTCVVDVDPGKGARYHEGLLKCLKLLCAHGAHPSYTPSTHATVVTILAQHGHQCLTQRDDIIREQMSHFLEQLLVLLLQYGLDSNHSSRKTGRQRDSESRTGNILVELVRLAQFVREPCDLVHIHRWVLTCLQWGANPDVEPYPSDHIICHSQSNIFLKPKGSQPFNQYMYHVQDLIQPLKGGGEARRVLMLFYNSMGHSALYQCLNAATYMSRFDPECDRMPSSVFIQVIKKLAFRPRSLKQIARVAIYRALDRQLSIGVPHLPLPNQLKSYLLDVE